MTRRADRQGYDADVRTGLLENDVDLLERDVTEVEARLGNANQQLQATVRAEISELRKNLVGVQRVLIGILVSLATASVLLAINIGVGK